MKRSTLKMILFCSSIFISAAAFAQEPQSSGSNYVPHTEPLDNHNPFPTDSGMTTARGGKTGAASNSSVQDVNPHSRTEVVKDTKHTKAPTQKNGTDIINDRKGTNGAPGTTGGNSNSQLDRQ